MLALIGYVQPIPAENPVTLKQSVSLLVPLLAQRYLLTDG